MTEPVRGALIWSYSAFNALSTQPNRDSAQNGRNRKVVPRKSPLLQIQNGQAIDLQVIEFQVYDFLVADRHGGVLRFFEV